ncbi:MAG TPA: DUF4406 domain-containing protein [Candidatus Kapabacteria bacterium]|nr:DUF4406 domain-containing protein [Candidatus Kapabacteria bacterium]HOM05272.1 DUF4406 domain-containing protein [Candidatus Kapabacteria bacterium]HPP38689.1 DUF4406 domain-containing protein [Candidatus Kapabacteria bacterium]
MKVYIAGKVSGEDTKECKEKFLQAEFALKRKGYEVVNPTKLVQSSTEWRQAMIECIRHLVVCDAIYMLNDWKASRGARLEHSIAQDLGLTIMYQNRADEYAERVSRSVSTQSV